jgi:hypothetical protein
LLAFFLISVYLAYYKGFHKAQCFTPAIYHLLAGFIVIIAAVVIRKQASVLQNRDIRSEIRFRYFVPIGQTLGPAENQLSSQQLMALHFASNTEINRPDSTNYGTKPFVKPN